MPQAAALRLRDVFNTRCEALLHGDLHTGSIMVTEPAAGSQGTTTVIDPEFAFVGPIAFDVAKLVGNLLLAFFSLPGAGCASRLTLVQCIIAPLWYHAGFR